MNEYYTYAYLRENRTPYYIGKGEGRRVYKKGRDEVKPPKDKFRIIFLKQNLTEEEAFKHEKYMIAVFGRKDLGTGILRNKTDGGEGSSGLIHTEETKTKISEVHKGRTHSEETKKKMSEAHKGRVFTEEHRKKLSEARKGKYVGEKHPLYSKSRSEETRRKLSEANKGENHPFYGKSHSEETRRKQSEANKGKNIGKKWWNDGQINKFMVECPGDGWIRGRISNI